MNILLWILQFLLAAHTLMGALWKLSNAEAAVPSLSAIPHAVWIGLSVLEVPVALMLVAPAIKRSLPPKLPAIAAAFLVVEMIVYSGVHLASGAPANGQIAYWGVVAAVCGFVALGRLRSA